jgi:hypothetical protein
LQRFNAGSWRARSYVSPKSSDLDLVVKVSPQIMSRGVDVTRLGTVLAVSGWLRDLARSAGSEGNSLAASEDAARFLLRTSEEATGIPCSASGMLQRLSPTSPLDSLYLLNGQHRLSAVTSLLRQATGRGKTRVVFDLMVGQLSRRLDYLDRDGHVPTAVEITHIADAAHTISVLLLDFAQHLLKGYVGARAYGIAFPVTECSPCGVLRLAAPRIPRAPGSAPVPGPVKFALAV